MFLLNPSRFVVASGGGGHAYWRISITACQSGSVAGAGEIQMRATVGGANQCVGGTGTAKTQYSSTFSAAKAFDGSAATVWLADGTALPTWIQYQFVAPVSVAELAIMSANNVNGPGGDFKDFTLGWSDDGASFTTALTVTGAVSWPGSPALRTFAVP